MAARALALVLALALALPAAGLAEDVAFHQGQHHGRTEIAMGADSDASHAAVDPGLGCHVHCGCHVAAGPADLCLVPVALTSRPRYARTTQAVSSVSRDRLPRPPRA